MVLSSPHDVLSALQQARALVAQADAFIATARQQRASVELKELRGEASFVRDQAVLDGKITEDMRDLDAAASALE